MFNALLCWDFLVYVCVSLSVFSTYMRQANITGRQADRQIDSQAGRQAGRQIDR